MPGSTLSKTAQKRSRDAAKVFCESLTALILSANPPASTFFSASLVFCVQMASSRAAQAFHLATSSFTPSAFLMQGSATSPTHAPPKPPVFSAVFRQPSITASSAGAMPWAKAIDASGRLAASIAAASLSFIGDLRSAHRKYGTQITLRAHEAQRDGRPAGVAEGPDGECEG